MTASEDGTSDYNCVDVIREAGATIVAAAQSTTSLIPPLGNDKSKVLTLNLRNRMIFRSADEADAVQAADFLGKKLVMKRSWGSSAGKRNVNYSETEEHKIKSYKLRKLRDHECVLVHCERGFRQVTLPPLEADGTVSKWFQFLEKIILNNPADGLRRVSPPQIQFNLALGCERTFRFRHFCAPLLHPARPSGLHFVLAQMCLREICSGLP